jgi:CHC2 zinc finger
MTATYIAKALNGRRSGSGWMARCPAHPDANPSLSVRESGGRILIHCFAGCTQHDVIAALRKLGLWQERAQPQRTPAERREYGRRRARAEVLAERALLWQAAMVRESEQAKTRAHAQYLAHPGAQSERACADTAQQLFFYEKLHGATLAQQYREAMERDPAVVDRLIAKAREDEAHARRCTARVVTTLAVMAGDAP